MQSNESKERREEQRQAKSARACMELLKADGITKKVPLYHMALKLFRDGYLHEFFIDDCITPKEGVYFIHSLCLLHHQHAQVVLMDLEAGLMVEVDLGLEVMMVRLEQMVQQC